MRMPLRDGETFSQNDQGSESTIALEVGSYALSRREIEGGAVFENLLRLDGIGEFVIPESVLQIVRDMPGSEQFTSEQWGKAILGKMLELGCQKAWSPTSRY